MYVYYLNAKRVIVFDNTDGRYVRELKKHGRASGEYLNCRNFDVSADSMIKSNPLDDGSFFYNETRSGYISGSQEPILKEYSTLIDSTGVVSRALIGTRSGAFAGRTIFFQHNNQLKVINSQRDTIFNLSCQNELSLAYVVSLGKYGHFKNMSEYDLVLSRWIYENDNFIFLTGTLPEEKLPQIFLKEYKDDILSAILYDKNEEKTYALKKLPDHDYIGFVNDIDSGAPFLPSYTYGNKMYQFIDAEKFIALAKQCDVPRMKEVASKLTEDSNPVMVVATLK